MYGEALDEQSLANAVWFPNILVDKLLPAVYLLRKEGGGRSPPR
jgi:hypothetical protein